MVTIRPLRPTDREAVADLITSHFADEWSYDVPTNDEANGAFVRTAERDDEPVGVMALTMYTDPARLGDAMHFFDTIDPIPDATRYGFLHAGYVHPNHTGDGIGSRLLERLHAIGAEHDVDLFAADAWFHGGADSPAGLLSGHGYDIVHRHSIAGHTDGSCPKCGRPCVCEAALAVRSPAESDP